MFEIERENGSRDQKISSVQDKVRAEWICRELEAKIYSQRQSFAKYLRKTLVFLFLKIFAITGESQGEGKALGNNF